MNKGVMLIVSGPSGSGKSSLIAEMTKKVENIYFSISTTTRAIREGEAEGDDYHFISKDEFLKDIEKGLFLEWAKVHDNYYGTSLKPVRKALNDGKLVLFDIDVQGYEIAKEKFGDAITSIFITTPSQDELKSRLIHRDTDSQEVIDKRLSNAALEMKKIQEYDYVLINDGFEKTVERLTAIAVSSKYRVFCTDTKKLINNWSS